MNKIIIALDGQHFPKGAFEFAKYINNENEILLAGVFLSPIDYSKLMAYSAGINGVAAMPEWLMKNDDDEIVNKNIKLFEDACNLDGLHFRIHKDNSMMAMASLIEETRYADLLLLSSQLFYENVDANQPNFYLEEILKKAECPVLLIPEAFDAPKNIILSYDGGESAVFAIKHFAYLFPELANNETTLINLTDNENETLPEYNLTTELLTCHYKNLQIQNLTVPNRKFFTNWLLSQPNSYIVMGSFSRSVWSQLFKKSFAVEVIKNIKMPIFISHK